MMNVTGNQLNLSASELIALLLKRAEQINFEKVYHVVVTDRRDEVTVSITCKGKLVKGYPRVMGGNDVESLSLQLTGLSHYLISPVAQGSAISGRAA